MPKSPRRLADESTALLCDLMETRSQAESAVLLLGALVLLMMKHELPLTSSLNQLGNLFSTLYMEEEKSEEEKKRTEGKAMRDGGVSEAEGSSEDC